ncbi:MAG: SDR family oxidoreductase [Xanthomonadales bacterium]|nr:SDR family oxidoreductase [Gammaproteobacteria bacterium]NNK05116.1 SDR family oxidoreductase [Xanthomonadales bacterium]
MLSLPFTASANDKGVVLVTGANRGLGLEFVQQLQAKGYEVIGTARSPQKATELKATGARVEQLDVADAASVAALAERLGNTPIDILINNAGMLNRADSTMDALDFDVMERSFQVNSLGPLRVTQALLPNLNAGKGKTVVSITSRLGSIELSTGGLYSYRTSKTALNQINKIMSSELAPQGFTCVVMHPGWVQTDMGGPNATLTKPESIAGMLGVIESLTADSTGKFFNYDGTELPW